MATKSDRIDLRLSAVEKQLIEAAAELRGTTLAGFAISTLVSQARVDIARSEGVTLELDAEAWEEFATALDEPGVAAGMRDLLTRPSAFHAV